MYSIKHKAQSEEIDFLMHLLGTGDTTILVQQNRFINKTFIQTLTIHVIFS